MMFLLIFYRSKCLSSSYYHVLVTVKEYKNIRNDVCFICSLVRNHLRTVDSYYGITIDPQVE